LFLFVVIFFHNAQNLSLPTPNACCTFVSSKEVKEEEEENKGLLERRKHQLKRQYDSLSIFMGLSLAKPLWGKRLGSPLLKELSEAKIICSWDYILPIVAGPPPGGTLLLFLMRPPSSETTASEKPEHQETKPTKNSALRESTP